MGPRPNCLVFLCYIDCLVICYPLLSQYSSSFDASKVAFLFRHDEQDLPGFLICSSAPATIYLIHDHDRRPASRSFHRSAAAASAAAAAFASPAGRGRPGDTEDLDNTVEYWIEEDDPEIASNAVICIDACTQYSRPSSRPGSAAASPRPIIGLCISGAIEAIITGAAPVYAPWDPRPSTLAPSPPPLYRDIARRVVRRPPPALLVQRPRTHSSSGNEPLYEPLISDTRFFL